MATGDDDFSTANGMDHYEAEENRAMSVSEDEAYRVELYVYDLSKGFAKTMSPALLGKQIEGVWHTGVVAYGREYFFGSAGIESCRPGGTILGRPDRIEDLGNSQVPYQLFLEYIFGLGESAYKPGVYDLLRHNCNNFSDEVTQFLCGRAIPKSILSLPDEVLNTPLGEVLSPLAKSLQLKSSDSRSINFAGGGGSSIEDYVPTDLHRDKDDPEFEELNSAIEQVRHNSLILEGRRNSLNEKLLKREKKERKKEKRERKEKKKKAKLESADNLRRHLEEEDRTSPCSSSHLQARRSSAPISLPPPVPPLPPLPQYSLLERRRGTPPLPPLPPSYPLHSASPSPPLQPIDKINPVEVSPEEEECVRFPLQVPHSSAGPSAADSMEGDSEDAPPQMLPTDTNFSMLPSDIDVGEPEPEVPREPPILFKDEVDTRADFEGFVQSCAQMLSPEEQQHLEELRAYVIEDEGSWALGDNFNSLFSRVFHDTSIPDQARLHLVRIMAAAALKDDVILMLHQDRKEHTIMNFANRIESHPPQLQEACALFFCNMFEHLSPSEWLLYISEWSEGNQQISNIRVTTKIAVNALLHANPKVQEYGTALMYNLGTKEVKTVVFDDVAPELAMAILQYFSTQPPEELVWRTITALCRFCYASTEVPALIRMIGPDPSSFKGMSPRVDAVVDEVMDKLSKVRMF